MNWLAFSKSLQSTDGFLRNWHDNPKAEALRSALWTAGMHVGISGLTVKPRFQITPVREP